jgi:hypothetical protein
MLYERFINFSTSPPAQRSKLSAKFREKMPRGNNSPYSSPSKFQFGLAT